MASTTANGTIRTIMSSQMPTCRPDDTPEAVLEGLVGRTWESVDTVYVLEDGALVGRIPVTDLLRSTDSVPISQLMESASIRLHPGTDREGAVALAIEHDRAEIPVVDSDGRLVGIVTAQAIIDTMHREHFEDVVRRAGVRRPESRTTDVTATSVRQAVRSRVPWLVFGLLAGLFLSVISRQFEATMQERIALAFFPPVIAYVADSVGTQSEVLAIRAFAISDVEYRTYLRREVAVGLLLGAMLGVLGGLGATVIADSTRIGAVVGLSLFASSTIATALASLIPIGFILLDVDPALGSGPIATALQDSISIVVYFLIALTVL